MQPAVLAKLVSPSSDLNFNALVSVTLTYLQHTYIATPCMYVYVRTYVCI